MLVTGNESGQVIVVPGKEDIAGMEAKLELVESMIETGLNELRVTGLGEAEIVNQLADMEAMRSRAFAEYDEVRLSVAGLESDLKDQALGLREIQARLAVVEGLRSRFELLDAHYDSDIKRLSVIEETGSLLESLPAVSCQVCGASPEAHRLEMAGEEFQLGSVHVAAKAEAEKIKGLKVDLQRVLRDLETERRELQHRADESGVFLRNLQAQIDQEFLPRVKESAGHP